MKMIDNRQYQMLKIVYEHPQGTPYLGIINETGLWPFSYIIKYKQLMWYHALIHSEERRVAKKILEQQIKEEKNNWAKQVMRWGSELELDMNMNRIKNINKAKWKKEIKEKSAEKIEKIIKEEAENKTKLGFIRKEKFEEKEYMKTCQFKTCKQIMKLRVNMTNAKANRKNKYKNIKCSAGCNEEETTEHLLSCKQIKKIVQHNIKENQIEKDMKNTEWLKETVKEMEKIEEIRKLIWGVE